MPESQSITITNLIMGAIGFLFTVLSTAVFFAFTGLRNTIAKLFEKVDDARERLKAVENVCNDRHRGNSR